MKHPWRLVQGVLLALTLMPAIGRANCDDNADQAKTPAAQTSKPATATTQDQATLGTLQRLSLVRPLNGGFDLPLACTEVHGYLMADAAAYSAKGLGNTDLSVRRADINFQRRVWGDWLFYADSELNDWHLEFKDVYLRKQTSHLGVVTIGNQQEPFGLEQYGSTRNTTFLERSTSSALAPSRSVGVSSNDFHRPWVWNYGFFTVGTRDEGRQQRGLALTGRLAYVLPTQDGLYHLAIDYSTRRLDNADEQRFNSAPEVALSSSSYFLDTKTITNASGVQRNGLEMAHMNGPFSWQAEYMSARLQRDDGLPTLNFHGWYAYASWVLTGESRDYHESNATFGSVTPHASWNGRSGGALEVAVRISQTDLNDRDVFGGKESNLTVGINWYLDKSVRLSANFVHALDLEKPGADYSGKHPSALVGRLLYQF